MTTRLIGTISSSIMPMIACHSLSSTIVRTAVRCRKRPRLSVGMRSSTASSPRLASVRKSQSQVYHAIFEVEKLENYRFGGFHPLHIGDKIAEGRYEIVHKLGYGGCCTVWLARDHHSRRYVKLKVMTSSTFSNCKEVEHIQYLQMGDGEKSEHPGKRYISSLLDTFSFEDPSGCHRCMVTEVYGSSLDYTKALASTAQFEADVARAIAARTLLGLAYIHSKGMIHGGEIVLCSWIMLGLF